MPHTLFTQHIDQTQSIKHNHQTQQTQVIKHNHQTHQIHKHDIEHIKHDIKHDIKHQTQSSITHPSNRMLIFISRTGQWPSFFLSFWAKSLPSISSHHLCLFTIFHSGFCWLNNVALATRHAQQALDVKKIVIIDWDVHHGNGTQNIFYEDENVLYISLHRLSPGFYPGTGRLAEVGRRGTASEGKNINIPWTTSGLGPTEYMEAFEQIILPIVEEFAPGLIMVSGVYHTRS